MKQLHKQSSLNHRRDEEMPGSQSSPYSPKAIKHHRSLPRSINYILREQRLLFILVGILIGSTFFILQPNLSRLQPSESHPSPASFSPGFTRHDQLQTASTSLMGKENLVHLLGNPRFELIRHDVVEPILLEVDQIYHLACPASPVHYKYNPIKTIISCLVLLLLRLLDALIYSFLLTSTSEVYGDPLEHPQKETYWGNVNPIGERSCYDEGKRTAETLAMDYHRGAGVEVRIARIFNTYGPRMCLDDGRVVSNFVAQAIRKQPMTVYGDGKQTRSFQYVSDLVEGLVALMEGEHVGPFNLGNPGEFTMLELAEVVKETIDSSATIEYKPNTADDPHMRKPDISKAKELLNWAPKMSLREGLPLMVNDFRNRILNRDEGKGL
ncbi:hypothetical protein K1719_046286 [Acacia pycnantha]|nr:hypothetical protein K1719_046286 [Acacia pycnantha]